MLKKIKAIEDLIIPLTVLTSAISYLVAANFFNTEYLIVNILAISIFTAALNSFNNYFDIPEDMLSKPSRPLPSQKLNPKKILIITFILILISIFITYNNPIAFKIMIIGGLFSIFYSVPPIRLKRVPIINTALITSNYIILPWLLAWSQTSQEFPNILILILFIITFGSVITKDFEDKRADEMMNNKTIPVLIGIKNSILIVNILTIFGTMILMLYLIPKSIISSIACVPALLLYININKNLEKDIEKHNLSNKFMIAGSLLLISLILI